jgi:transcriptional regulator with XRE-family HTH domain
MTKDKISSFGEYLRELRENAALPLRKVAAKLDIDPSLLAKIERDERKPTKNLIMLIAKLFRQDEHKLLIEFLSDQIAYQVLDEEDGIKALKVAEQKVKYFIKSKEKREKKNTEK